MSLLRPRDQTTIDKHLLGCGPLDAGATSRMLAPGVVLEVTSRPQHVREAYVLGSQRGSFGS